jgi:hypothetical protein
MSPLQAVPARRSARNLDQAEPSRRTPPRSLILTEIRRREEPAAVLGKAGPEVPEPCRNPLQEKGGNPCPARGLSRLRDNGEYRNKNGSQ